jgi:hypothetical protein
MSNGYLVAAEADIEAAREIGDGFSLAVLDIGAARDPGAVAATLANADNVGLLLSKSSTRDAAFFGLLQSLAQKLPRAQLILVEPDAISGFGFLPQHWPAMSLEEARRRASALVERRAGPPESAPVEESQGAAPAPEDDPQGFDPSNPETFTVDAILSDAVWVAAFVLDPPADAEMSPEANGEVRDFLGRYIAQVREALARAVDQRAEALRELADLCNALPQPDWTAPTYYLRTASYYCLVDALTAAGDWAGARATIDATLAFSPPEDWLNPKTVVLQSAMVARRETLAAPASAPAPLAEGDASQELRERAPAPAAPDRDGDQGVAGAGEEAFGAASAAPPPPAPAHIEPPAPTPAPRAAPAPAPAQMQAPAPKSAPSLRPEPAAAASRTRGGDSSLAPATASLSADASAFAPRKLRRETPELVRVVIYQPHQLKAVLKAAKQIDPRAEAAPQGMRVGEIAVGASVGVSLDVRGANCDGAIQKRSWNGEPIDFSFTLEADAGARQAVILARVFVGDAQVGVIGFTRPISGPAKKPAADGDRGKLKRHKRVFLSYSSHDRGTVAAIATAYQAAGIDYFWDRSSLQSGEEWSPRLRKEIDRADLFHLCWSKSAAQSEWVEKETEHALMRRKRSNGKQPDITVQMLDGPPWAPHPASLDGINFDDFVRAAVVGYARGDGGAAP